MVIYRWEKNGELV